jgi:hypothetical protein
MEDDLKNKTVKQLKSICKEKKLTNYSKLKKEELINKILGKDIGINKNIIKNIKDKYSKEVLKNRFNKHLEYYLYMKQSNIDYDISCRLPSIPEDISENIIKFIIQSLNDKTCKWNREHDLISEKEGIQECKCFTSDGPISFTPKSEWNCIYFLDGIEWCNKKFKLYKFPYKRTSDEWKNIKVNKKETFQNQCEQGRRPRISWNNLYFQIKDNCNLIFNGSIEDIL